jgi:hypothetical protein
MKHLIEWRLFESSKEEDIESICREYNIENWTLNHDGTIDVDGNVDLSFEKLYKLPLKFRNVSGNFYCSFNNLTSLEGCPKSVNVSFYCNNNNLTSLEGCPESVGGNFLCYANNLTSLEGSPKSVDGNFWCDNNNLTSLERVPESIRGQFYCKLNPVEQIWNLFEDKDKIEFFNDLDIIRGNSIVLDRLIYFLDVIGKPKTEEELRNLIKDYTFI